MVRNRGQRVSQPTAARIPSEILLSGIRYYVCPSPKGAIRSTGQSLAILRPCTIISSIDGNIGGVDIENTIARFLKVDDVYSLDFVSYIIIQTLGRVASKKRSQIRCCERFGPNIKQQLEYSKVDFQENLLPPGPYFVYGNGIYEAWRLYPDFLDAFQISFMPAPSGSTGKNEELLKSAATGDHIRYLLCLSVVIVQEN